MAPQFGNVLGTRCLTNDRIRYLVECVSNLVPKILRTPGIPPELCVRFGGAQCCDSILCFRLTKVEEPERSESPTQLIRFIIFQRRTQLLAVILYIILQCSQIRGGGSVWCTVYSTIKLHSIMTVGIVTVNPDGRQVW